jgi:DNA-binding MarR family transcriptional regulator
MPERQQDDEYGAIGRELGMLMRRVQRMQDRRSDPGQPGLDRAAYLLLGQLVWEGPDRLSALAAEMCVDLSAVSRQVAALEAAGFVTRTPDPADRRASRIAATEAGTELFLKKRDRFLALLRTLLAGWTAAERANFADLMSRFNRAMAAHDEGKLAYGDE